VGASLLSETWPAKWRHWIAAILQSGVNLGVLVAMFAGFMLLTVFEQPERIVFLVGIVPALLVVWIRLAVPEPEGWREAQLHGVAEQPKFIELFQMPVRRITVVAILVCATSLTAHWAFMFWFIQHLRNLPDVANFSSAEKNQLATQAMALVMITSI